MDDGAKRFSLAEAAIEYGVAIEVLRAAMTATGCLDRRGQPHREVRRLGIVIGREQRGGGIPWDTGWRWDCRAIEEAMDADDALRAALDAYARVHSADGADRRLGEAASLIRTSVPERILVGGLRTWVMEMLFEAEFLCALQFKDDVAAAAAIARAGIDALDTALPAPAWPAGADGVRLAQARAKIAAVLAWLEGVVPAD